MHFLNRTDAGRQLALRLEQYREHGAGLVLALPRGGVPVAAEVASMLHLPMDAMLVRKIGVPGHEELALGAIASQGIRVFNEQVLGNIDLSQRELDLLIAHEERELRRRDRAYRHHRPPPMIRDRVVIVIDDGLATGASMKAAIAALRQQQPARIVVAVPVAPRDTIIELEAKADEVVCVLMPDNFLGVGRWYEDFTQLSDEQVRDILEHAWHGQTASGG